MKIFKSLSAWQIERQTLTGTIGFVPTMGNLHQGHLSLYQQSINQNELTIASLFINPTQFNNEEDFQNYPKTIEQDLDALQAAGVDYCLQPAKAELYADNYCYQLKETQLSKRMEGQYRQGHFEGVLTVVLKLLNLVQPNHAYFGEKDYQQYQLIKNMVDALFINTHVIGCPTVRDQYGLALSSRNNRLSSSELEQARLFAQLFHQGSSCQQIIAQLQHADIGVDYVEEHQGRRYAAVFINNVRLIDNYSL